jgi:hypothetical protein
LVSWIRKQVRDPAVVITLLQAAMALDRKLVTPTKVPSASAVNATELILQSS